MRVVSSSNLTRYVSHAGISMEMRPIEEMYAMLERNLPSGFMDKSEVDKRTVLESGWRKMVATASVRC